MGLDNLSKLQIRVLQIMVSVLLFALTVTGAWTMNELYLLKSTLPKDYVMAERYKSDQDRVARSLDRIDGKLDRLIERRP
jgi:hypothetical protein